MCAPSHDSEHYQRFLQQVEDANPRGQIMIITDNLSSHQGQSNPGTCLRVIAEVEPPQGHHSRARGSGP
jgi:hypothetical protein